MTLNSRVLKGALTESEGRGKGGTVRALRWSSSLSALTQSWQNYECKDTVAFAYGKRYFSAN